MIEKRKKKSSKSISDNNACINSVDISSNNLKCMFPPITNKLNINDEAIQ